MISGLSIPSPLFNVPRAVPLKDVILVATACLIWLTASLEDACAQVDRVLLIMSQVPAEASVSYRALKRRAGNVIVEMLPLTKAEVWSVPADRVDRVRRAAVRYGVIAERFPADWNHVFRPMPMGGSMSQEHKAMLDHMKSLGMAMAIGQTFPARAAMVEYALTRTAGRPTNDPATIILTLNDATKLTVSRVSVDVKSDMLIWRGTVTARARRPR